MNSTWDIILQGGALMIPIISASVISLCVFFERLWSLRASRVIPYDLISLTLERASAGRIKEAITLCQGSASAAATVMYRGLTQRGTTRAQMKESIEEIGQIEVAYLGRYIELLGTIASVAPLLGLLGTVVGMIDVFRAVVDEVSAQGGAVNPASLASGIWGALITTAAGLSAAIPAFLGYKYLLGYVDRIAIELEEIGLSLLEAVYPSDRVASRQVNSDAPRDVSFVSESKPEPEPKPKPKSQPELKHESTPLGERV